MPDQKALYEIADEVRAIANSGLLYAVNDYDKNRYERLLRLSARLLGALEARTENEVMLAYQSNLAHLSPLVGAGIYIYRDNKVLLGRRADNGLWDTFAGLVDVGEALAEAAVREAREEAGIEVSIDRLLAVFDSRLWQTGMRMHMYHAYFQAKIVSGTPSLSNEVTELRWFKEAELADLTPSKVRTMPVIFKLLRGELVAPYFDQPGATKSLP